MNGNEEVKKAVGLQAANLMQKAMLDMLTTKILLLRNCTNRLAKEVESVGTSDDFDQNIDFISEEMDRILRMTRDEAAAARAEAGHRYPYDGVDQVITKAVDDITKIILGDA